MQGLGSGITLGIADRLPRCMVWGKSHLVDHGLAVLGARSGRCYHPANCGRPQVQGLEVGLSGDC